MAILGIEAVVYGVEDVATCARFFEDAGLNVSLSEDGSAVARVAVQDTRVELKPCEQSDLPAAVESGSTVREIVWGVSDQADLDAIAGNLRADREVRIDSDGRVHAIADGGFAIAFEISKAVRETDPPTLQRPPRIAGYQRPKPDNLGHLGIFTNEVDRVAEFFIGRLGFTQSDSIVKFGRFLRAPGSINHHNLFVAFRPHPGMQHLSLRVRDIDELGAGSRFLESRGWKRAWGPGRWGPGSDIYVFFVNPAGGLLEIHFDEDFITDPDSWEAKVWDPSEIVLWGEPPPFLAHLYGGEAKRPEPANA